MKVKAVHVQLELGQHHGRCELIQETRPAQRPARMVGLNSGFVLKNWQGSRCPSQLVYGGRGAG